MGKEISCTKKYKAERNSAYFTYMEFPAQVQRCIYTTNWIERLNRKYRRTCLLYTSSVQDDGPMGCKLLLCGDKVTHVWVFAGTA